MLYWPLIIEEEYIDKYQLKEYDRSVEQSQEAPSRGADITFTEKLYLYQSIISNTVSTRRSIGKMADSTTTNVKEKGVMVKLD